MLEYVSCGCVQIFIITALEAFVCFGQWSVLQYVRLLLNPSDPVLHDIDDSYMVNLEGTPGLTFTRMSSPSANGSPTFFLHASSIK